MRVFIGSSTEAIPIMQKIAVLLEDIDFVVKCWKDNESFILGKTISENLSNILNEVDAAIFIYAEDDKTWYKDRVVGSPRDNVLFEHGFFAGKLGLNKSIIIRYKEPKMPSDLEGIIYAEYQEAKHNTLKEKLKLWKNDIEKSNNIK
jgi:predicted nucleotide-binding protein